MVICIIISPITLYLVFNLTKNFSLYLYVEKKLHLILEQHQIKLIGKNNSSCSGVHYHSTFKLSNAQTDTT